MKFLCPCLVLLTVAIVVNGDSCSIDDLDFTEESMQKYEISGHNINLEETESSSQCRENCENYDQRIGTCSHYSWMGAPLICLTTGMVAVQSKPTKCRFFNGPMEYEHKDEYSPNAHNTVELVGLCNFMNDPIVLFGFHGYLFTPSLAKRFFLEFTKKTIGRALCEDEIRSIQQGATASWKRVITCRNPSSAPIECSYSKTVGVTKSSSETSSSGFSESQELSLTVGMEVGDPWGVAKTSMSASMTSSLGQSWGFDSSSTFGESSTESVTTGVPSVPPGQTKTICQAQGTIGEFILNSPDFKVVDGDSC